MADVQNLDLNFTSLPHPNFYGDQAGSNLLENPTGEMHLNFQDPSGNLIERFMSNVNFYIDQEHVSIVPCYTINPEAREVFEHILVYDLSTSPFDLVNSKSQNVLLIKDSRGRGFVLRKLLAPTQENILANRVSYMFGDYPFIYTRIFSSLPQAEFHQLLTSFPNWLGNKFPVLKQESDVAGFHRKDNYPMAADFYNALYGAELEFFKENRHDGFVPLKYGFVRAADINLEAPNPSRYTAVMNNKYIKPAEF